MNGNTQNVCLLNHFQVPLPSGQLSPLATLMPTIHQAVLACDQQPQLCTQQHMAMNLLNVVHHAPAQMVYRAMESTIWLIVIPHLTIIYIYSFILYVMNR